MAGCRDYVRECVRNKERAVCATHRRPQDLSSGHRRAALERDSDYDGREYLRGDPVRLKKYLYVLRPLLAIRWLESGRGVVPMPFRALVATLLPAGEVRDAIERLLVAKQSSGELAWGPRIPALSDWIAAELERLEAGPLLESAAKPDSALLDRTFRDWLES